MDKLTLEGFLKKLGQADLQPDRRHGHLALYDRGEVLTERADIQTMRVKLNPDEPQSWIPWIVENRNQFLSERFRAATAQSLLNSLRGTYDLTQLAA